MTTHYENRWHIPLTLKLISLKYERRNQNLRRIYRLNYAILRPDVTDMGYLTWLPADMYLGGQYHFHEMLDFGALYRLDFYQKSVMQSLTLSANSNRQTGFHSPLVFCNEQIHTTIFGFWINDWLPCCNVPAILLAIILWLHFNHKIQEM